MLPGDTYGNPKEALVTTTAGNSARGRGRGVVSRLTAAPRARLVDIEDAEGQRLAVLAKYEILDTPPDGAFDRIAAMAARMLDTPLATVSIVDADRIWFKATHGLDGVEQIGRDPGLCASAIYQDDPYVVNDALTDPRTAENPLVHGELGIRFYAAAPIITKDGYRLGTVNVLDTKIREIAPADIATLEDLAGVVADQLELRLSALTTLRQERMMRIQAEWDASTIEAFASTLQRTLLPPTLPPIAGCELACHYHAASPRQVTGDFYDVFSLDDRRWAFFLGDVAGHGAIAATVASLSRYTLRAAALHTPDPAEGLAELNTALLLDPHHARFCTVLFGIAQSHPDGGIDITLANGGHPSSLLLRPDGDGGTAVEEISLVGGMLVGALEDATFTMRKVHLSPGETLLLYTDGLTEARPGGEFFGEDGLFEYLATRTDLVAPHLISEITSLIAGFEPAPSDDVALLALSIPAEPT